jgi:altronate dehydratase small subunit
MSDEPFSPFLQLHPQDNVLVARANAPEGLQITLASGTVRLARAIPMAHKIAACPIAAGDAVQKYGMVIGVATQDIAAGAHVHIHNLKSAYTPSVALQDADGRSAGESQ